MSECVNCTLSNGVAVVEINRPKALNALNAEVLASLYETMQELDQNQAVKVVILTGSGEKAFVAGADISAMQEMTSEQAKEFAKMGHRTMNRVAAMRPFTIAAVNGFALGGGCELAMSCDIRVASTKARMGIPEVTLGVIPGFGGTQRLPRLVGLGRAKELLATGRQVKAEEAMAIGLVNAVKEPEELLSYCKEMAEKIVANSTTAISYGKRAMDLGTEMGLPLGLELEIDLFGETFTTPDQREGMTAFVEKRKPNFA